MIHKVIRYLFPPRRMHERLPLRPLEWSSHHSRHGDVPDHLHMGIDRLMAHNIVGTRADGYRMIKHYKDKSIDHIITQEKRKRRHTPRLLLAWRRLKKLW